MNDVGCIERCLETELPHVRRSRRAWIVWIWQTTFYYYAEMTVNSSLQYDGLRGVRNRIPPTGRFR